MAFIPSNKNNPCSICSRTKSCGHDPSTNVYRCISYFEDDGDFKYLYEKGGFGIFVPRYDSNSIQNSRKFLNQIKKEPEIVVDKLSLKELYTLQNTALDLPLAPIHKQQLVDRGLTAEQIKKLRFFSLIKGQKVAGASRYIAGFDSDGVYTNASGIAIPALDFKNNILGYQIKPDEVKNNCKYLWTTHTDFNTQTKLNSAHIDFNGTVELPLTMRVHEYKPGEMPLYISEGFLKSAITSAKHSINVLGAGGKNHMGSIKQLGFYVHRLKPTSVIWLADSGSGSNPNVWSSIVKHGSIFKSKEIPFYVADWGQLDSKKPNMDCDEISSETFKNAILKSIEECGVEANKSLFEQWNKKTFDKVAKSFATIQTKFKNAFARTPSYLKNKNQISFKKGAPVDKKNPLFIHTFEKKDRQYVLKKCVESKYKFILDQSPTGSGKSFAVGNLKPEDFSTNLLETPSKLYYLSQQHRFPSTPTIESNFVELPTKHDGLHAHSTKRTPNGNYVMMREWHQDSPLKTDANCSFASKQSAISQANSTISLCKECPIRAKCSSEEESGSHGYLFQKAEAMKSQLIRGNLKGINPNDIEESDVVFVDEAQRAIEVFKNTEIQAWQLKEARWRLESTLGDAFKLIQPLFDLFDGKTDLPLKEKMYGRSKVDYLATTDGEQPSLLAYAHQVADQESQINADRIANGEDPIIEMGGLLLRALSGVDLSVSLTLYPTKIVVTHLNISEISKLSCFNTVFLMDATLSPDTLATSLGIDRSELLVIAEQSPIGSHSNLTVLQVQSLNNLGAIRAEAIQEKTTTLRSVLEQMYPGKLGVVEKKKYSQSGDLIHFSDARGSNEFESKTALLILGEPIPNLNAVKAQFEVLYGVPCDEEHKTAFNLYLASLKQSEIMQEIGRLRSNRRLNENLLVYFASTADLTFLEDHSIKVVQVTGGEIHPDLETNGDRIVKMLLRMHQSGVDFKKMSIRKMAEISKVAPTTLHDNLRKYFSESQLRSDSFGDHADSLMKEIVSDPQKLLYWMNGIINACSDPDERQQMTTTCLRTLAFIKRALKEDYLLQAQFNQRIIELGLGLNVVLTAVNIVELEKQLT